MPSLPLPAVAAAEKHKNVFISLVNLFNLNADCLSPAWWLPQYNSHSSFTFFGNSVIQFFFLVSPIPPLLRTHPRKFSLAKRSRNNCNRWVRQLYTVARCRRRRSACVSVCVHDERWCIGSTAASSFSPSPKKNQTSKSSHQPAGPTMPSHNAPIIVFILQPKMNRPNEKIQRDRERERKSTQKNLHQQMELIFNWIRLFVKKKKEKKRDTFV